VPEHGRFPEPPRRCGFRLVCIAAPILVLTILGIGAATASTVLAANVYYLHNPGGAYTIDNTLTTAAPCCWLAGSSRSG